MKPSRHVIVSFALGAGIWFFTKSFYAGILCFISGVLVDLDHIIEYSVHFGLKDLTIKKLYEKSTETEINKGESGYDKLYLVFHSNEVAILLWMVALCAENIYIIAFALGYSSHLILDCIGNTISPVSYFIIKRYLHKFKSKELYRK